MLNGIACKGINKPDPTMNENKVATVVFAKEHSEQFKRCSFPILGRPVCHYPILAALNCPAVDATFLSTPSPSIVQVTSHFENLNLLKREDKKRSLGSEINSVLKEMVSSLGYEPLFTVILLGNSPCVISEHIESALNLLANNPESNSVVSASQRKEFAVENAFKMNDNGFISVNPRTKNTDYNIFIDARMFVIRTSAFLNLEQKDEDSLFRMFGDNILPIFQEDGVADIDYPWQIPFVERWLLNSGFNQSNTPYRKQDKNEVPNIQYEKGSSSKKSRIFISTVPFGEIDNQPIKLLEKESRCEFLINPLGRKLKPDEIPEFIKDCDVLIAGTELLNREILEQAKNLKMISRVGIGLDNVALKYAAAKGIKVSYTPDAPSAAVAELTMGHIFNGLRQISLTDRKLRDGIWQRHMGKRLGDCKIGIIGTGRIGSRVLKHLQGFSPAKIYVHDLNPDKNLYELYNATYTDLNTIYKTCDIISLHIPLNKANHPLIGINEMKMMKHSAFLINTSRGGIIDENDLYTALSENIISGAAIDVFDSEPYNGKLIHLDNCYLSCHMGSCTIDCRYEMELKATEEALRFIRGEDCTSEVPEIEIKNSDD
jgi:D-3-phosphoglycerate dehydrogenase / 2-oxoglutarate reductase